MINRQDLQWAERWPGRAVAVAAVRRWLGGQADDVELEHTVAPFVQAVAVRTGLTAYHTSIVLTHILKNALPELNRHAAPQSDEVLWHDLAWMVLYHADCRKDEQRERGHGDMDEADNVMAQVVQDVVAAEVETRESGIEGEREDEVLRITEEEVLRQVERFGPALEEWNRRELEARVPIYMMIRSHPGRYRPLVALWATMGSAAFEEFAQAFAGQTIRVPSAREYQHLDRLRQIVNLAASGETQEAIGRRFRISQSAVSQRLEQFKETHRRTWLEQERGFLAALNQAVRILVRATTRRRLRSGKA
jgi:hypothetical protein